MVTTKELETRMEFYEKNLSDRQESMHKTLETVQVSIESLIVEITAMNAGKKITNDKDHHSETPTPEEQRSCLLLLLMGGKAFACRTTITKGILGNKSFTMREADSTRVHSMIQ